MHLQIEETDAAGNTVAQLHQPKDVQAVSPPIPVAKQAASETLDIAAIEGKRVAVERAREEYAGALRALADHLAAEAQASYERAGRWEKGGYVELAKLVASAMRAKCRPVDVAGLREELRIAGEELTEKTECWQAQMQRAFKAENERDELARDVGRLKEMARAYVQSARDMESVRDFFEKGLLRWTGTTAGSWGELLNIIERAAHAPVAEPAPPPAPSAPSSEARTVAPASDEVRGLYRKYEVTRLHDPTGKHDDCEYYVLDWVHDPFTLPAMAAYADACAEKYPNLARDLRTRVHACSPAPVATSEPTAAPALDDLMKERLFGPGLAHKLRAAYASDLARATAADKATIAELREIARREADHPEPPASATGEVTTALDAWLNEMRYLKLLNDGHVFFARERALADQRAAVKPWRERAEQAEAQVVEAKRYGLEKCEETNRQQVEAQKWCNEAERLGKRVEDLAQPCLGVLTADDCRRVYSEWSSGEQRLHNTALWDGLFQAMLDKSGAKQK